MALCGHTIHLSLELTSIFESLVGGAYFDFTFSTFVTTQELTWLSLLLELLLRSGQGPIDS